MEISKSTSSQESIRSQGARDIQTVDTFGVPISLRPSVGLYRVRDFMGQTLLGLAVQLDLVGDDGELESYATLTTSFGEFIGIKNAAYIDINNCPFAENLLKQGIADPTDFYKVSGFCQYPLWIFREDFLQEIGSEHYQEYSKTFDQYMGQMEAMFGAAEGESEQEEAAHGDFQTGPIMSMEDFG